MESFFGIGRRSRRSSMVDQEPIQIRAPDTNNESFEEEDELGNTWIEMRCLNKSCLRVPLRERYFEAMEGSSNEPEEETSWPKFLQPDMNTRKRRTRAVSMVEHNHSYNARDEEDSSRSTIPTVFKYSTGKKEVQNVYLTGNMTNWTCVPMCRPKGELDYYSIIGCRTGNAIFKFFVDGEWTYNKGDEVVKQSDNTWNILKVQESDCDVFNALACDSLLLKDNRRKQPNDEDRKESDAWGQDKPSDDLISSHKNKGPPGLPPHLLQVLLNKEPVLNNSDPVILHEPLQVSLNHLYAQSIRDNMLVLSTTHRFRKKCVTLVLYKPI
uniref:5'-AMP-activated protein kinase subunit beta-1 n=2 Tax=Caligus rogercresseyi TaxID=217165 RepID=C1BNQ2_CALRO|nr:5-AMP-activated protein kinase subunit beta-1 [Caligus rogercresseyi]